MLGSYTFADNCLPRLPRSLMPQVWGVDSAYLSQYIDFDDRDSCVIGGDKSLKVGAGFYPPVASGQKLAAISAYPRRYAKIAGYQRDKPGPHLIPRQYAYLSVVTLLLDTSLHSRSVLLVFLFRSRDFDVPSFFLLTCPSSFQDVYVQRLAQAMDRVFASHYGVQAADVADVHHYLYLTAGKHRYSTLELTFLCIPRPFSSTCSIHFTILVRIVTSDFNGLLKKFSVIVCDGHFVNFPNNVIWPVCNASKGLIS